MSERQERQERMGQIDETRDKARQISDAQTSLDELLGALVAQTQRLGESWDDPAASEIQGIVATAMRQLRDASAVLNTFAQTTRRAADEADRRLDDATPTDPAPETPRR